MEQNLDQNLPPTKVGAGRIMEFTEFFLSEFCQVKTIKFGIRL